MNNKYLPEEIRPNKIISALLIIWGIVNLIFTILWIGENVFKIKILS
jgi:uncharacterized membrane protein